MLRHVKFANLPVIDQDRALAFWRDRLGFAVAADEPYGDGCRWIERGAQTRIVFVRRPDETPSEQPDLILVCDEVDQSFAELKAKGVTFTQDPTTAPWRPGERYALFRDSEGNLVMLGNS
jgi:catechol 2,3-dioxygenase-like lactoylglutathione lyase family enzyme